MTQSTDPTPEDKESPLVAHARRELELLGEDDETIEAYLAVIKAFVKMNHSGASATVAIPVIVNLLSFKNLTDLTTSPDEWNKVGPGVWQSARNPEAFSSDGGKTYKLLSEGYMEHNSAEHPEA